MPSRHFGDLNEEPLARRVFETGFDDTKLHSPAWVHNDLAELRCTPGAVLPVDTFAKVQYANPDGKPPAFVSKAVLCRIEWERCGIVRVGRITNEAPCGVRVETDHKKEGKVVRVPEGFKALVANLPVSSCVHQNHDKKHEVTSNATRLVIVNILC